MYSTPKYSRSITSKRTKYKAGACLPVRLMFDEFANGALRTATTGSRSPCAPTIS